MKITELRVHIFATEIGDLVWQIVEKWDYFQKDTIGVQFVKSADSISANIAEGFGRFHFKENRNLLYYSRGSAYETLDWLSNARRRKLIFDSEAGILEDKPETFLIKLNAYIKSIGQ